MDSLDVMTTTFFFLGEEVGDLLARLFMRGLHVQDFVHNGHF
jgi:hypothetical protein